MSNVPTQPLPSSPATPPTGGLSRPLLVVIIIAGVLLLSVIALLFLLLGRSMGESDNAADLSPTSSPSVTASDSPSPTPEQTEAAPPPPVDKSTKFTSFSPETEVMCDAGDADNQPPKPEIHVSWTSANAVEVWYTANNGDAADDQYMQVPLNGSQADFTDEHLFDCFHRPTQDYTLTLVGPKGEHVSKHWTVTNVGDQ